MTPEQSAAFVIAQAACAMAEIAGMQAMDRAWLAQGHNTYNDIDYQSVIEKYCIGHNATLQCFQDANR